MQFFLEVLDFRLRGPFILSSLFTSCGILTSQNVLMRTVGTRQKCDFNEMKWWRYYVLQYLSMSKKKNLKTHTNATILVCNINVKRLLNRVFNKRFRYAHIHIQRSNRKNINTYPTQIPKQNQNTYLIFLHYLAVKDKTCSFGRMMSFK